MHLTFSILYLQRTEGRYAEINMHKDTGQPIRSVKPTDELQLGDPSKVDGWEVTHESSKVCF